MPEAASACKSKSNLFMSSVAIYFSKAVDFSSGILSGLFAVLKNVVYKSTAPLDGLYPIIYWIKDEKTLNSSGTAEVPILR